MTATILTFPAGQSHDGEVREPLAGFAAAAVTSVVPCPLVRACQYSNGYPERFTVGGQPVTVTVTGARMSPDAIVQTWLQVRDLAPAAGSHIRIAGGRVLVCPPSLGGAA